MKDVSSLATMDPSITSVVVGLDKSVNYVKLSRAAAYIRDQHCSFIATNSDAADPTENGLVVGAAGMKLADFRPLKSFLTCRINGKCHFCDLR